MATYIKQGDIFGRVGSNIGKGLAEQLPEEITRGRLQHSLQQLGSQKELTPFQQFTGLASAPGATPQIVQSGSDLLRQQAYLDSIKNQYAGEGKNPSGYKPTEQDISNPVKGEMPTLATPEDTAQSYKEFIPPTDQQERAEAAENFNANPARYHHNFDNALAERKAITTRNQDIQLAHQNQEKKAVEKEEKLATALKAEIADYGLKSVPPTTMKKFEKKILSAVLGGKTQGQAVKENIEEMRQVNREHQDLGALDSWSPKEFNTASNALQKAFAKRGDQQQYMDQMIADHAVSPQYAAHKAYPTTQAEREELNAIPGGLKQRPLTDADYGKLKEAMGEKGSPLSIAYELERKEIDPSGWLKYLNENRDSLKVWQEDQLTKGRDILNLKDFWLRAWE